MPNKNVKQITFILFFLKFVSLFSSILTLSLSAKFFGITSERDSWVAITSFIMALSGAVFGPLNETFRAKFTSLKMIEGAENTLARLRQLIGLVIILCILVALLVTLSLYIFPEFLLKIIVPVSYGDPMLIQMFFLLIPTLLINQLISLGISILNTYDVFYVPEFFGIISGIINVVCIYLLAGYCGIYSLIISQYIYSIIYLLVILYFLIRLKIRIYPQFKIQWNSVKPFIKFSIPFFFPYFITQINIVLEKSLANSLGEGIVSTLDYARKLTVTLQAVLTTVLASVMVPDLSKSFFKDNKNDEEYVLSHHKYFEILILILIISTSFIWGSGNNISKFLYLKGDIDNTVVLHIASLLKLYGLAFVGIGFYLFWGLTMLSQGNGKSYAILGVIAQVILIILNLTLYKIVHESIFPISLAVSHFIAAIIMFIQTKNIPKKKITILTIKAFIIILLFSLIIFFESQLMEKWDCLTTLIINAATLLGLLVIIAFPLIGINIKHEINRWKKTI